MPILLEEQLNYPLPQMHRVRQSFSRPRLEDIEAHIKQEITKKEISEKIKPGAKAAVAVGSRGIKNLAKIVKEVIGQIKEALYKAGAVYASMSGSGSSVFGLFEAPTQLKNQFSDCFVWEGQLP